MDHLLGIPEEVKNSFESHTVDALTIFPNTVGQCVALCAYISSKIREDNVECKVALGSLSCGGIKTFQYIKAFSSNPNVSKFTEWDGHAWIEFGDDFIGEPSLIRTANARPIGSNLRSHLTKLDMLGRGAFLSSKEDIKLNMHLKYTRKNILKDRMIKPLIAGLFELNSHYK